MSIILEIMKCRKRCFKVFMSRPRVSMPGSFMNEPENRLFFASE